MPIVAGMLRTVSSALTFALLAACGRNPSPIPFLAPQPPQESGRVRTWDAGLSGLVVNDRGTWISGVFFAGPEGVEGLPEVQLEEGVYVGVVKYDATGRFAWARLAPRRHARGDTRLVGTPDDKILLAGHGEFGLDAGLLQEGEYDGAWLMCLDGESGALRWQRELPEFEPTAIDVGAAGDIVVLTTTAGTSLETSTTLTKLSPDGSIEWSRGMGDYTEFDGVGSGHPVLLDDGRILLGGVGPSVIGQKGVWAPAVSALAPDGTFLWTRMIDGVQGGFSRPFVDDAGDIVLIGLAVAGTGTWGESTLSFPGEVDYQWKSNTPFIAIASSIGAPLTARAVSDVTMSGINIQLGAFTNRDEFLLYGWSEVQRFPPQVPVHKWCAEVFVRSGFEERDGWALRVPEAGCADGEPNVFVTRAASHADKLWLLVTFGGQRLSIRDQFAIPPSDGKGTALFGIPMRD